MRRLPGVTPRTILYRTLSTLLAMSACLVTVAPARASGEQNIVTQGSTYVPGDDDTGASLVLVQGHDLTYTNLDLFAAHSVTSDLTQNDPNSTPIFDSGPASFRRSVAVTGIAALTPGRYHFHCSIHGSTMQGSLLVVGA